MTASPSGPKTAPPARPWRFRFGLFTLLVVMTLISMTAAVAGGLLREGVGTPSATYVLAATAAPLALVLVLGIAKWAQTQVGRFRRRRN